MKKFLVLLFAIIMAFSLFACDDVENGKEPSGGGDVNTNQPANPDGNGGDDGGSGENGSGESGSGSGGKVVQPISDAGGYDGGSYN